ncbi:MAG: hypothetical protein ABSE58_02940 [Candidatus Limnocylindrales bacterium]|jgi:hypothetical protein
MTQDFDAAEERARLAAADLAAAAADVIKRHSIRWRDARDEVDFAELSRWTRYYPERKLDDAREDLGFASRAQTEVGSISASRGALATEHRGDAVAAEAELVGRLGVLADECERRAIYLRS